MSGPGDRASKHPIFVEPTHSSHADGHDGGTDKSGTGPAVPPGSKSSAKVEGGPPGTWEGPLSPPVEWYR